MEFFAVLLDPYKDLIATSAATVTYLHQLSGAVICNNIRKQKSTTGFPIFPFLAGTVISALVAIFGLILNDTTTVRVHLIGIALNVGYLCVFFWYTNNVKDRTLALNKVGYAGAFLAVVFAYTFIENSEKLPFRFSLILTSVLFYFIGSPFLHLGEVIRKKSTHGMPFPIILTGTLISFLWFLHGIVTRETFAVILNGLIFSMNAIQLSMFVIYPSKPPKSNKSDSLSTNSSNNNNKKTN